MEGEHELRDESVATRAEAIAAVKSELIEAAYDELNNGHIDAVLVEDNLGHSFEYTIPRDEAQAIEEALWSAGELQTLDALASRVVAGLERNGGTFQSGVRLRLRWQEAHRSVP